MIKKSTNLDFALFASAQMPRTGHHHHCIALAIERLGRVRVNVRSGWVGSGAAIVQWIAILFKPRSIRIFSCELTNFLIYIIF